MTDDVVRSWHEILVELGDNHKKLAGRILATIREYEKVYHVTVSDVRYEGDGTVSVAIEAGGAVWDVEASD